MASADDYEYEDEDEDLYEEEFNEERFNETLIPNPNSSFESPIPYGAIQSASNPINGDIKPTPSDESRRLFQRLFTEEDEIVILQGFLDFVTKRGTTHNNHQHDTGPFYEQIKGKIPLEFNKNQLLEKIRRLKKKYRTIDSRIKAKGASFTFKSAHEKATYEISKQIWNSALKTPRNRRSNNERSNLDGIKAEPMSTEPTSSVVEETVKCCLSPLFKELLRYGVGVQNGGFLLNLLPLSLPNGLGDLPKGLDGEKWKAQQILELEVYLKRVELLEEQIKVTLDELRSSSSSAMKTDG